MKIFLRSVSVLLIYVTAAVSLSSWTLWADSAMQCPHSQSSLHFGWVLTNQTAVYRSRDLCDQWASEIYEKLCLKWVSDKTFWVSILFEVSLFRHYITSPLTCDKPALILTNQRPVFMSRDLCWPIRAQYSVMPARCDHEESVHHFALSRVWNRERRRVCAAQCVTTKLDGVTWWGRAHY